VRTRKFMQTLDSRLYSELEKVARRRGITVQQLIRAIIVPEWFRDENPERPRGVTRRAAHLDRRRARRLAPRIPAR
jgi:hypothetical protein